MIMMTEIKEKWLKKWFDKEISKTEMYFINNLDEQFDITRIRASIILDYLMYEKINVLYSFVRNNQSYTLNEKDDIFFISTPRLWFKLKIEVKKESILNFMNKHLKQINYKN